MAKFSLHRSILNLTLFVDPKKMALTQTPGQQLAVTLLLCLSVACQQREQTADVGKEGAKAQPLFQLVAASESGIDFENTVTEDGKINYFNYGYIYNGGGVAVGDIDGDGLADLYFSATMGSNKLYRNLGDFRFEDITDQAGVAAEIGFKTGVLMADVNADGKLDIYVCRTGNGPVEERSNLLFINQGEGRFLEQSVQYGLGAPANTNHAVFFDADGDGDLDCYWLNHPTRFGTNTRPRLKDGKRYTMPETVYESDRLFRNDGGHFTDITVSAGVVNSAFGLSLCARDFNGDGFSDLFIANDYIEPDYLYINNGNGTFSEQSESHFDLISQNSMGSDAADLDNDGDLDLIVLDMLPETQERQKSLMTTMMLDRYQTMQQYGYGDQQMRNVLQLNRGNGIFSEVAQLAGLHASDWSWAPLAADFDNNGFKDVFISNGYRRDVTNLDYIRYKNDSLRREIALSELHQVLDRIPSVKLSNYLYLQDAEGRFRNAATAQGLAQPTFSNGAVYADLNNDGLLDLVVNNLEDVASVYRNTGGSKPQHWLRVRLSGPARNPFAVGSKVIVEAGGQRYTLDAQPVRGYFGSVDPVLNFGLGQAEQIDKVWVQWPDGQWSSGWSGPADKTLDIQYGQFSSDAAPATKQAPVFRSSSLLRFAHRENPFEDFKREFLLPRRLSREGPFLSSGDFNEDGLQDVFVGGASGQAGSLFLQERGERFRSVVPAAFIADARFEDTRSCVLDANGDGHDDLYVCSGGYEATGADAVYQDRLYLGDGKGQFVRAAAALPAMLQPSAVAVPFDWDGDGDTDLFVGGRALPGNYPAAPRSYLLRNDGGRFSDVTETIAPDLLRPGMVTDASWIPAAEGSQPSLLLCGEWMPLSLYRWSNGKLSRSSEALPAQTEGWWNALIPCDVNADGRTDFIAGNMGRNTRFQPSTQDPLLLLAKDFDANGQIDPVLFRSINGIQRPVAPFDLISTQLPYLRKRFHRYQAYSRAGLDDVFPAEEQSGALRLFAYTLESCLLIQDEQGRFQVEGLPAAAQAFPVFAGACADWDGDGIADLVLGGNFDHLDVESGPVRSGKGLLLRGTTENGWIPVEGPEAGIYLPGEVRSAAVLPLSTAGKTLLVFGRNNAESLSFTVDAAHPPLP